MSSHHMLLMVNNELTFYYVTSGFASYSDDGSDANSIDMPVGVQAGDLAFHVDTYFRNDVNTTTTPSGWTQLSMKYDLDGTGRHNRSIISYKVLVSGDIGSKVDGLYQLGHDGGGVTKSIIVFRPSKTIGSVFQGSNVGSWQDEGDSAFSNTTLVVSGQTAPLIILSEFSVQFSGDMSIRRFTNLANVEISTTAGAIDLYVKFHIANTAPSQNVLIWADDISQRGRTHAAYLWFT